MRLAKKEGGTLVTIEHARLGVNQAWVPVVDEIKKGWSYALDNLPSILETGEDLRFTLRPMLGIITDSFNAEAARELGIPVTEGLRLGSVVEGRGAAAAGLQANDVLVSMDGVEYAQWGSLANIIQSHRAGDRIEVGFYRGSERKSVIMELSKRPLPDIPSRPEVLAAEMLKRDEKSFSELEAVFAGVSDEEAAHRPGEDDWSAKEVLAHLIHELRSNLSFINDLLGGYEPLYDDYGPNTKCRVSATLAAIPTLSGLLEEYRRISVETASFIECLPESFLENKGSYWRIAHNALLPDYHLDSHLDQMRGILADARK